MDAFIAGLSRDTGDNMTPGWSQKYDPLYALYYSYSLKSKVPILAHEQYVCSCIPTRVARPRS